MSKRDIVVMGGSLGSFEVFKTIVAALPAGLDASIFIVWHMPANVRGILSQVLNRVSSLEAKEARDGDRIEPGRIYVARADHHLLLDDSHVRVVRGPKENRFRPAIDPLFRSAAYTYGRRVIGIITSGSLDDGTSGLWTVKQRGGLAVAQDPGDAEDPSMPASAIRSVDVDYVVPMSEIAGLIARLTQEEVPASEVAMVNKIEDEKTRTEIRIAAEENAFESGVLGFGELSPFTCPECSGVLIRLRDGDRIRFRCHTGHAFSADSLLAALSENIEQSLWNTIRGVEESIMLLNHLGDHFAEVNQGRLAAKFFKKANEARQRNELVRKIVLDHELLTTEGVEHEAEPSDERDRGAAG
jgi:two-component system chemotaxis response regulator CheB